MLEEALDRVQAGFAHVSASTPKETIERALVLQKSILKHIEDRERSVRTSELECVLKNRSSAVVESYLVLASRFLFLDLATYGITALEDLKGLDLFTQSSNQAIGSTQKGSRINPKNYQWDVDPFQHLDSEDGNTTQMPAGHLINEESLCLQAVLTDWQNVAAHTIETELLAPRRIGSLCFLSSETALLAMKLASMVRIGLINPSARRTKIVLRLLEIWRQFWRKNFPYPDPSTTL